MLRCFVIMNLHPKGISFGQRGSPWVSMRFRIESAMAANYNCEPFWSLRLGMMVTVCGSLMSPL
jgi:hypothetical protein